MTSSSARVKSLKSQQKNFYLSPKSKYQRQRYTMAYMIFVNFGTFFSSVKVQKRAYICNKIAKHSHSLCGGDKYKLCTMVGLRSDVNIQNCYMVITIFVMSKGNCTKKQKEVTLVTGVQYCSRFRHDLRSKSTEQDHRR